MKRWMKQICLSVLALLSFGFSGHATAGWLGDCFDCFDGPNCWEVGGTWIYWRPCSETFVFADQVDSSGFPTKARTIKPDYHSGFRLHAGWYDCQSDLSVLFRYTYLKATDNGRTKGPFSSVFGGGAVGDFTEASRRFNYQTGEFWGAKSLSRDCGTNIYGLMGLRYIYLEEKLEQKIHSTNVDEFGGIRSISMFSGVALQLGLGGEWCLCDGLGFVGEFRGLVGIGEHRLNKDSRVRDEAGELLPQFKNGIRAEWTCVPGVDAKLGLNYTWPCACVIIEGEVGYEVNYLFAVASRAQPKFPAFDRAPVQPTKHNVGFHGPYVTVKARF